MFGLGAGEILLIALLCLILFGREDLPATVKKFSKGIQEFRKVTTDAQRSWNEIRDDVHRSLLEESQEDVSKTQQNVSEAAPETKPEQTDLVAQVKVPEESVARSPVNPYASGNEHANQPNEGGSAVHHTHHEERSGEPQASFAGSPVSAQQS